MEPLQKAATVSRRSGDPVILCVDDEPEILSAIRRCLRTEPYEVITAGSGDEALAWLAELEVDVVITDERMPGMTGTELLLEARKRCPRTARALLTGYRSSTFIRKGLEAGVDTFLYKPWDDRALRMTVDRILRKASKADPAPFDDSPAEGLNDLGGEGG
jgi:YesN/AraC family two-component response regulator